MSKTLLLLRHGKSDWKATYGQDHDRPLNPRGRRASGAMGRWLAERGPLPDLVICSTAVRARSTCRIASKAGGWNTDIQYEHALYHAAPGDLIHYLQEVPDHIQTVMMVGHQPTWSMTAALLSEHAVREFPTASMVRIDLPVETWECSVPGAGTLIWHQFPRQLARKYYNTQTVKPKSS